MRVLRPIEARPVLAQIPEPLLEPGEIGLRPGSIDDPHHVAVEHLAGFPLSGR